MDRKGKTASVAWQKEAVRRAHLLSRVKWTPVADGLPMRGKGCFKKGVEYTGVPYSSVKHVGSYIGFDISLRTFLAAVQNPLSVVYTESLKGKVKSAACYYGAVCSSFTSYGLGCSMWYRSVHHTPPHRDGVAAVEPQSAQAARVGDVVFTPPQPGAHVELVTAITRDAAGKVTHVRVEDSWPPTMRNIHRSAKNFNAHIGSRGRKLYRITDRDAWLGQNKAGSLLFPNYELDSATPAINRVLLLDRGDWVPYKKGQPVRFNLMDRDNQGIKKLVIKRGRTVVEELDAPPKGVVERQFPTCGDYTAYCVMADGSLSATCEFAVCDFDFSLDTENIAVGKPVELTFTSDNVKVIIAFLHVPAAPLGYHGCVFVTDKDRRRGKTSIPGDLVRNEGALQIWLMGEHKLGRLKLCKVVTVKK